MDDWNIGIARLRWRLIPQFAWLIHSDIIPNYRRAVPLAEQGAVAGVITSANGISYVLAPALGISLYGWNHDLPFAAFALLLLALAAIGRRRLAA